MTELAKLFNLKPKDEEMLNSHARDRFNDWQARILSEVSQLSQLNIEQINEDLTTYLKDNERTEFNKDLAGITEWLSKCMDGGEGHYSNAYAIWVISPMIRVESLIVRTYQAKEEKAKGGTGEGGTKEKRL